MDCLLNYSIFYCWYSQLSGSSACFRYLYREHRFRTVSTCPQTFLQISPVLGKPLRKLRCRHFIYSCAPTILYYFATCPFKIADFNNLLKQTLRQDPFFCTVCKPIFTTLG